MTAAASDGRRARVPGIALVAATIVLIAAGGVAGNWMLHGFRHRFDLIDLAVYRAAADAILHGHSVFGDYVGAQLRVRLPFIYPPFSAVLAVPFAVVPATVANIAWTAASLALLGVVVRIGCTPLQERFAAAPRLVLVLGFGAALALTPVQENLRFGQVGIALMACCVIECARRPTRLPGLLVGLATAIKLVPGIFIPYLWCTGRRRAARGAVVTFGAATALGFVVAPGDSWDFFRSRMFEPTSPRFFSNQSLRGMLERAIGGSWEPVWLVAAAVVVGYGLRHAVAASRAGDELRGVAITGLVGVLVSPISWVHHLVWVVPALAVVIGNGRDRRRVVTAFGFAALFVARLPFVGDSMGSGLAAALLEDSYGLLCIALLVVLARAPAGVSAQARCGTRSAGRRRARVASAPPAPAGP